MWTVCCACLLFTDARRNLLLGTDIKLERTTTDLWYWRDGKQWTNSNTVELKVITGILRSLIIIIRKNRDIVINQKVFLVELYHFTNLLRDSRKSVITVIVITDFNQNYIFSGGRGGEAKRHCVSELIQKVTCALLFSSFTWILRRAVGNVVHSQTFFPEFFVPQICLE